MKTFSRSLTMRADKLAFSWARSRSDWTRTTFSDVGAGVREIRIREESGAFRVMYVAKFEEAVYVLHCFQKKTQATSIMTSALHICGIEP